MTLADREHLKMITDAPDDVQRLQRIIRYWADQSRAERTSRDYLVLHLGIVAGMCERLLREKGEVR